MVDWLTAKAAVAEEEEAEEKGLEEEEEDEEEQEQEQEQDNDDDDDDNEPKKQQQLLDRNRASRARRPLYKMVEVHATLGADSVRRPLHPGIVVAIVTAVIKQARVVAPIQRWRHAVQVDTFVRARSDLITTTTCTTRT